MRAARLHAPGSDFVLEDVALPEPGPGAARIRIGAAGACHSDLHIVTGDIPVGRLPRTLGHENAGWIDALGPRRDGDDHRFAVGDPVVVFGGWGCGHCRECLGGSEQMCDVRRWGGMGPDGGYADQMLVPSTRHLLPADGLDIAEAAALTDAGLTPYAAVSKALPRLRPGTSAIVIGAGGLGQYAVQFLRTLSAARVVVVDPDARKREIAASLGAHVTLDPSDPGLQDAIRARIGTDGAAAVFDFVGRDETMRLGTDALGRRGMFVLVGISGGSVPFSFFGAAQGAVFTSSNWGTRNELADVLDLARAGRITSRIRRFALSEINDAFDLLRRGEIEGRAMLIP